METFPSASSFETSLTFQTRNHLRDASFSSYLNKAEENMILKLTNLHSGEDEEEIDVFDAKKYFKDEFEEKEKQIPPKFSDRTSSMHQQQEKDEEVDLTTPPNSATDRTHTRTPSVRSETSWNSRSGLLPGTNTHNQARKNVKMGSKTRAFLATFGCKCIDKKSTEVTDKRILKPPMKTKTEPLPSKWPERSTRDDFFSFPVMNSNKKVEKLANGSPLSLGKKLSLLTDWDVGTQKEEEMHIPSSVMYNDVDSDSDASSDLFEIGSFSTNRNGSVLANRISDTNCYAPSEVSIDWSVVTASAADFSVASDFDQVRAGDADKKGSKEKQKKRPGILSGCKSHKAVRVVGDEYRVAAGERVVGGGGEAAGGRRWSESTTAGRGKSGSDGWSAGESRPPYASRVMCIQH